MSKSGEVKNVLPKKSKPKNIIFIIVGLFIILAVLGVFGFLYFKKEKEEKKQAEITIKTKEEQQREEAKEQLKKPVKEEKQEITKEIKDWQSYENKLYRYKVKFPKNWFSAPENKEDSWIVYFTNYDPKIVEEKAGALPGVKVEILVQGNPRNLSLSEWVKEGHLFSGEPKSSEEIIVAGLPAIREEVDFEGLTTTVYFFRGNDVVTLSYTGSEPDYSKNKEIFDLIVKSLEIEK